MSRDGRHVPVDLGTADRARHVRPVDLDHAIRAEGDLVLARERGKQAAFVDSTPSRCASHVRARYIAPVSR